MITLFCLLVFGKAASEVMPLSVYLALFAIEIAVFALLKSQRKEQ